MKAQCICDECKKFSDILVPIIHDGNYEFFCKYCFERYMEH